MRYTSKTAGPALWDTLWEAGQAFNLPRLPHIEGGLRSYGNDMTRENNPLEYGLNGFCDLDDPLDCIGIEGLRANLALGMTARGFWDSGQPVQVRSTDGKTREGFVTSLPFAQAAPPAE